MNLTTKLLRPLGSGIAMGVPLITGILSKDPMICSVGAMGAFFLIWLFNTVHSVTI